MLVEEQDLFIRHTQLRQSDDTKQCLFLIVRKATIFTAQTSDVLRQKVGHWGKLRQLILRIMSCRRYW